MNTYKIKIIYIFVAIVFAVCMCGFDKGAAEHMPSQSESMPQSESGKSARVPIVMYHNIRKGGRDKFTISPEELQKDFLFLAENGYSTVTVSDLIDFVYEGNSLPEKPVMLTFDDGSFGVYKYAVPLLKEHKMKAVMSIIGICTDKYSSDSRTDINFPNLTWAQVNEMIESGCAEFQNHSYNLHCGSGACKGRNETNEIYGQRLKDDLERMQQRMKEMTNYMPQAFTYPFGKLSKASERIVKEVGFKASISCYEGENIIQKGEYNCLYVLKRFNRPFNKSVQKILL